MTSLEQARRFERARNQYENLLMNAESVLIDEQTISGSTPFLKGRTNSVHTPIKNVSKCQ